MSSPTLLLMLLGLTTYGFGQDLKCASSTKYYIPNVTGNWFQATEYCNSIGMRLAVITNAQDNTVVVELAKADSKYKPAVWIGGSDLGREGEFYWQPTGAKFSYTNWNATQPDDMGNENCVEIRAEFAYNWNDHRCELVQHFVCENIEPNRVTVLF
ncbi:perlucin-like protein [Sabethes cyaneus]|uniref:perlucin-like protein n=1 Tax=Sabethes cyaneus TaxID=53552 RepID=UPI00237E303F|nr:perlucin-like protein [Sabethes cyaneus]